MGRCIRDQNTVHLELSCVLAHLQGAYNDTPMCAESSSKYQAGVRTVIDSVGEIQEF